MPLALCSEAIFPSLKPRTSPSLFKMTNGGRDGCVILGVIFTQSALP